MIDHVGFAVSDAERSRRFYEQALAPLGITLIIRPELLIRPRTARPNPSVEARPNGRPPGPGWWYAYIFTSPGLASCRRSRLTSNVRRHRNHAWHPNQNLLQKLADG